MSWLLSPEAAFGLLFVFLTVYFVLDGYALGIGCRVPFVGAKPEADRLVAHLAPVWEANEVWLVMAVGFLFAAFPAVYAMVICAFYLPFMAAIGALILRAMALEFSYHDPARSRFWRLLLGLGSFVLLFGTATALGLLLQGVRFAGPEQISGDLSGVLAPLPLLFGGAGVAFIVWHGVLHAGAPSGAGCIRRLCSATWIWLAAMTLSVLAAGFWLSRTPALLAKPFVCLGSVIYLGGLGVSRWLAGRGSWGGRATSVALTGLGLAVAASLYPNILVSAEHPEWTLSIRQAAAQAASLRVVMAAAPLLVVVIACYSYWVQRMLRR